MYMYRIVRKCIVTALIVNLTLTWEESSLSNPSFVLLNLKLSEGEEEQVGEVRLPHLSPVSCDCSSNSKDCGREP